MVNVNIDLNNLMRVRSILSQHFVWRLEKHLEENGYNVPDKPPEIDFKNMDKKNIPKTSQEEDAQRFIKESLAAERFIDKCLTEMGIKNGIF